MRSKINYFYNARIAMLTLVAVAISAVNLGAQDLQTIKASINATHNEKVKKTREDGFVWLDVQEREKYRANLTFTLDSVPADWTTLANNISVSVGDVFCDPEIKKSRPKGGSATFKERDKEDKSSLKCSVKWKKRSITVKLSGSNFDGDNLVDPDDETPKFEEEIEVYVDLGRIAFEALVTVRGSGTIKYKIVKTGRGEDAEIDDFELFNWRASGNGTAGPDRKVTGGNYRINMGRPR